MAGTSMATPAVAGAAALVRQYLVDGMHQVYSSVGFAGSSYSSSAPSGALIKAILIGSTMPLTKGYDSSYNLVTLSDFYDGASATADDEAWTLGTGGIVDFHQGFGHVLLTNAFSLTAAFPTFLYEAALGAYGSWTVSFTVASTATEVDVTLVWSDPPSTAYCDYYDDATCLVHDLDLRVTHAGTRLFSNFGAASIGLYAGQEDTKNNVEKITIDTSSLTIGDSVTVVVATDSGLAGFDFQSFALVVTGNMLKTNFPSPEPSFAPTASDTITVSVALTMTTTQGTISTSESNTLKATIAATAGVASYDVKKFSVTITSRRRRLLASYTWSIAFDIVTELSSTSSSSSATFVTSVSSALGANLASAVQTSMSLTATVTSVYVAAATRHPSLVPTSPSAAPSAVQEESSIILVVLIGAAVGAALAGCFMVLYSRRVKRRQRVESDALKHGHGPQEPGGVAPPSDARWNDRLAATSTRNKALATWKCQKCTYDNRATDVKCRICETPAATAGAATEAVRVTVPLDATPGKQFQLTLPDGRAVTATVPPGAKRGDSLEVLVPRLLAVSKTAVL
jgi:hypothetical protein